MPTLSSSQQNILLAKPQLGFIELDYHGNVLNAKGGYLSEGNFSNLKTGDHCSVFFPGKAVHAIENAINGKESNIKLDLNNDLVELAISPQGQGQGVAIMLTKLNSPEAPSESLSDAQRFETLFNAAHDAIFTMNDREFIDCNPATLKIFGCKRDQIIGQTPMQYSPSHQPDGRPSEIVARSYIDAALSGSPQFFEWQHVRWNGTPFDAEVSLNKLIIGDDAYIQAIVRNISDRKLKEKALRASHDELIKINEDLDRFVYSASHDLRAPITSLMGLVDLMQREDSVGSFQEYLGLQEKSLKRLDRYIKDIVDYSSNARLEVEPQNVNFDLIVKEVLDDLGYMENMDKIEVEVQVEPNQDFKTDPRRISVIFNNLLSNAIKYSDLTKAQPSIKVNIDFDDSNAKIVVSDNGEGVPKGSIQDLFKMFFRASSKGTGSGLGLYIVKDAVDKLKGTVSVESIQYEGANFTINIPNLI